MKSNLYAKFSHFYCQLCQISSWSGTRQLHNAATRQRWRQSAVGKRLTNNRNETAVVRNLS